MFLRSTMHNQQSIRSGVSRLGPGGAILTQSESYRLSSLSLLPDTIWWRNRMKNGSIRWPPKTLAQFLTWSYQPGDLTVQCGGELPLLRVQLHPAYAGKPCHPVVISTSITWVIESRAAEIRSHTAVYLPGIRCNTSSSISRFINSRVRQSYK